MPKYIAGEERRKYILALLKQGGNPVKASELAQKTGVSRQVIVQDMALLRARQEQIIATPQGYICLDSKGSTVHQRVIVSRHSFNETEQELTILVDHGVTVLDVGIEHSIYGKISRPLGLKNRLDVKNFMLKLTETESNLLCSLTDGVHFHTIEAQEEQVIDQACAELARLGFLES